MLNNTSITNIKDKINTVNTQFHFTDTGNAKRLIHQNKNDIRYCPEIKMFLIWDGKHWCKDTDGEIMRRAMNSVLSMYDTAALASDPTEQLKWAKTSESRAKLESMISLALTLPGVPISFSELDKPKYLLNCLNGTINLETGELLPHDRKHKLTHLVMLEYRSYQENFCPQWINFLHEITNNDQELINYLWRLAGLCLSSDTSEHLLHILYGAQGRNGKGIYIGTLQRILGDLSCTLPFSSFEPKNSVGIPNDIARMFGKRLIVAQESREGVRLDEAVIKTLTGADILTGRFLRCEFFDFEPTHKLIMSTNNMPVIYETSDAIWARLRIVPFEVSFYGREDKKLVDKLNTELPEILSWAVAGFQEWMKHGLKMPKCMETACKEYRSKEDIIQVFIDEACCLNQNYTVTFKDLYNAFVVWATTSGEKPLPKKLFNSRIRQRNFAEYKAAGLPRLRGIGLADNESPY